MNQQKYYLYRFLNKNGEIIYIGRTRYINHRLTKQHFTADGHLDEECYDETEEIQYTELTTLNEQHIYEIYLIGKHSPKYNTQFKSGKYVGLDLPDLTWHQYVNEGITTLRQYEKTLMQLECTMESFSRRVETCLHYMTELGIKNPKLLQGQIDCLKRDLQILMDYKNKKFRKINRRKEM